MKWPWELSGSGIETGDTSRRQTSAERFFCFPQSHWPVSCELLGREAQSCPRDPRKPVMMAKQTQYTLIPTRHQNSSQLLSCFDSRVKNKPIARYQPEPHCGAGVVPSQLVGLSDSSPSSSFPIPYFSLLSSLSLPVQVSLSLFSPRLPQISLFFCAILFLFLFNYLLSAHCLSVPPLRMSIPLPAFNP